MRSFFCDRCSLEFDVEEEIDEGEDKIFCPQCKLHLARILPETPERMISREHRLAAGRREQRKRFLRLLLITVMLAGAGIYAMSVGGASFWIMILVSLAWGVPAGVWTRRLTFERSWRSAALASLLFLGFAAVVAAGLYFSGHFVFSPACRNLAVGLIPAWIIAAADFPGLP